MSRKRGMTRKDISLEFLVGAFFFGALILLGVFTIILSRDQFLGKEQTLRVRFPSVAGLREGDGVLVHGVQVGTVDSLELLKPSASGRPSGGVGVELSLNQPVPIYNDHTIEVRYSSMLGGRHLVIEPGTAATGKADLDQLTGTAPADLINEATQMVQTLREELDTLKEDISQGELIPKTVGLIENLQAITEDVRAGKGTLGKLFAEDTLHRQLTDTLNRAGDAGAQVEKTAATANEMLHGLREGRGTLGKLLVEDKLYGDAKDILAAVSDGQGTLGKLVMDDSLHADLRKIAADISGLTEQAANKDSTAGRFLSDDGELYNTLLGAAEDMRTTMRQAQDGEGTVGRLLRDPELYNDLLKTVNSAKAAVQDFREQAPVSTFGSLIFGAF
ncbi:MAG: MlaD family protein [Verrucomicrobiota bacterium]